MQVRAVALDVDGTLAAADHRVSERSLRVLAACEERGVHPILVTGRTAYSGQSIARAARLTAPQISCNGAVIGTVDGEPLRVSHFTRAQLKPALRFAAEHDLTPILWTQDGIHAPGPSRWTDLLTKINGQDISVTAPEDIDPRTVVKISLAGDPKHLDALQDTSATEVPEMKRSMSVFLEASPPSCDKWSALKFVLDRLEVSPDACLGFADGDTDAAWMSKVGYPVALDNASDSVKTVARLTIGHHADDAVAKYLESLLS